MMTRNPYRVCSVDPEELKIAADAFIPLAKKGEHLSYEYSSITHPIYAYEDLVDSEHPHELYEYKNFLHVLFPHRQQHPIYSELLSLQDKFIQEWKAELQKLQNPTIAQTESLRKTQLEKLKNELKYLVDQDAFITNETNKLTNNNDLTVADDTKVVEEIKSFVENLKNLLTQPILLKRKEEKFQTLINNLKGKLPVNLEGPLEELKTNLQRLFKPRGEENIIKNINAIRKATEIMVSNLKSIEKVQEHFAKIIQRSMDKTKSSLRKATARDSGRGLYIVNSIKKESFDNPTQPLSECMEGVELDLVNFFMDYQNQENLIGGANFAREKLAALAPEITPDKDGVHMYTRLKIEDKNTILVTYEQSFENFGDDATPTSADKSIPSAIAAKSFVQYQVKLSENPKVNNGAPYDNIEIVGLTSHLEIYDPVIRKKYIESQVNLAAKKIREGKIPLTSNEKLAIELHLNNLKTASGDLDEAALKKANADTAFLWMWNNVHEATHILTKKLPSGFLLKQFFQRPAHQIQSDLDLIEKKHKKTNSVSVQVEKYRHLFEIIASKDVKKIAREMTRSGNRHELLMCMHSINSLTDANFIQKLIENTDIRNNLNRSLATHFILQDESLRVCRRLLNPSWWERVKFNIRSAFKWTSGTETLPRDHFTSSKASASLNKIVAAFPILWNSLFSESNKEQRFQDKLLGRRVRKMMREDPNGAHFWAVDQLSSNKNLFEKANYGYNFCVLTDKTKIEENKFYLNKGVDDTVLEYKTLGNEGGIQTNKLTLESFNQQLPEKKRLGKFPSTLDKCAPTILKIVDPDHEANNSKLISLEIEKKAIKYKIVDANGRVKKGKITLKEINQDISTKRNSQPLQKLPATIEEIEEHEQCFEAVLAIAAKKSGSGSSKLISIKKREQLNYKVINPLGQLKEGKILLEQINDRMSERHQLTSLPSPQMIKEDYFATVLSIAAESKHVDNLKIFTLDEKLDITQGNPLATLDKLHLKTPPLWKHLHTKEDRYIKDFYQIKFTDLYNKNKTSLIDVILDLWTGPAAGKDGKSVWRTKWLAAVPDDDKKPLIKQALIAAMCDKTFEVSNLVERGSKNLPEKMMLAEIFLTKSFPNITGSFKKAQLEELQIALLNNGGIFHSLFNSLKESNEAAPQTSFKNTMRNETNLFLFKTSWQVLLNRMKDPTIRVEDTLNKLLDLSTVIPSEIFANWLSENTNQCATDLLKKLINHPGFYQEFIKRHKNEVKTALLNIASVDDLLLLLLTCKELSELYFEKLHTGLTESPPPEGLFSQFESLISQLQKSELSLIIAKHPDFLKIAKEIGLSEKAELDDRLSQSLDSACPLIDDSSKYDNVTTLKINSTQQNLVKKDLGSFTQMFTEMMKWEPTDIEKFLVEELMKAKPNEMLIDAILDNSKLLNKILTSELKQLTTIVFSIQEKLDEKKLTIFVNHLLQIGTLNPDFSPILDKNALIDIYITHADLSILAIYLSINKPKLDHWEHVLTKIIKDRPDLFKIYHDQFKRCQGFDAWVIKQENKVRQKLFFSDDNLPSLISEKDVISYLSNPHLNSGTYLVQWMLEQQEPGYEMASSEPRIRDLLIKYPIALSNFIRSARRCADDMIQIAVHELKLGIHRNVEFLTAILSMPYISYLLEHAKKESIKELILVLQQSSEVVDNQKNPIENLYFNTMYQLISLCEQHDQVCQKLIQPFESEEAENHGKAENHNDAENLLTHCLHWSYENDKKEMRKLLLKATRLQELPVNFTSEKGLLATHKLVPLFLKEVGESMDFIDIDAGNQCVEILINLLNFEGNEHLNEHVENLLDRDLLALMLTSKLQPTLLQKLLIKLYEIANNNSPMSASIKNLLSDLSQNENHSLERIITGLPENEVINLYLADGVNLPAEQNQQNKIYYFKKFLIGSPNPELLDRVFLYADERKLIELLEKDRDFAIAYAQKLQKNEKGEDTLFAQELRKRLCSSKLPLNNNLVCKLIGKLDEKQDSPVQAINLMNDFHDLRQAFYSAFEYEPSLLIDGSGKLKTRYIDDLILHGKVENLANLFDRLPHNKRKLITDYFHTILQSKDRNPNGLLDKLIKHFGKNNELDGHQEKLIQIIISLIPVTELCDTLIKHPDLNHAFITYFTKHPQMFEFLFISYKDQPDYQDILFAFTLYFQGTSHPRLFFLLKDHLRDSELTKQIDKFYDIDSLQIPEGEIQNQDIAVRAEYNTILGRLRLFVADATASELIRIVNIEKGQENKPFTKFILSSKEEKKHFTKMLNALSEMDEELVNSDQMKNMLFIYDEKTKKRITTDIGIVRAYLNVFSVNENNSKLSFSNGTEASLAHKLSYLYALHIEYCHEYEMKKDSGLKPRRLVARDYLKKVNRVAKLNNNGRLVFKDNEEEVIPLSHCLHYFEASSHFIYERENADNIVVQETIETQSGYRHSLISTLDIDIEGNPKFVVNPQEIVPLRYLHTVLYAYSHEKINLEKNPGLIYAFIKSVVFVTDRNDFFFPIRNPSVSLEHENAYLFEEIPVQYREMVVACIDALLKSGEALKNADVEVLDSALSYLYQNTKNAENLDQQVSEILMIKFKNLLSEQQKLLDAYVGDQKSETSSSDQETKFKKDRRKNQQQMKDLITLMKESNEKVKAVTLTEVRETFKAQLRSGKQETNVHDIQVDQLLLLISDLDDDSRKIIIDEEMQAMFIENLNVEYDEMDIDFGLNSCNVSQNYMEIVFQILIEKFNQVLVDDEESYSHNPDNIPAIFLNRKTTDEAKVKEDIKTILLLASLPEGKLKILLENNKILSREIAGYVSTPHNEENKICALTFVLNQWEKDEDLDVRQIPFAVYKLIALASQAIKGYDYLLESSSPEIKAYLAMALQTSVPNPAIQDPNNDAQKWKASKEGQSSSWSLGTSNEKDRFMNGKIKVSSDGQTPTKTDPLAKNFGVEDDVQRKLNLTTSTS